MRIFVYFLSIIFVLSSANVYALLPVGIAVAGAVSGEIAVGTGKAVIKKMSNETKKDLVKSATAICAKNPALASFCSGVVGAVVGSSLEVEVNNVSNNNDIDVNIYKKKSNKCNEYQTYITSQQLVGQHSQLKSGGSVAYLSEYFTSESQIEQAVRDVYSKPYRKSYGFTGNMTFYKDSALQALSNYQASNSLDRYDVESGEFKTVSAFKAEVSPHNFNDKPILKHDYYYVLVVVGSSCNSKNAITEQDIDNIFNSLSDDDITNIYNYDYSQYNNITVNNNTITGDTINNSKNNFDKNYNEKKLSENATTKMKNKDKDYTIDKINDDNCTKNEKNEYDKCGSDRDDDKKDDTDDKKDDDVASNTASTPASTEFPDFCDWAKFICDTTNKDTKVDVADELPEMTDTEIVFSGTCPADVVISQQLFGNKIEWRLMDWTKYCSILSTYIKPIVIAMSSYSAILILAGRNESN